MLVSPVEPTAIPELFRRDLRYLVQERARVIGQLVERNPSMAELLMDLEADYDLRTPASRSSCCGVRARSALRPVRSAPPRASEGRP
jgi:hypothetical protein